MPFQKRPRETTATPPSSPPPPIEPEDAAGGSAEGSENHEHGRAENDSDSDGISYSSGGEKNEFIFVDLGEIRKEVQCPICLGVIRKTRTVMECLHRFCRECIDKSMRLGNNECPACRTHCASRRSLRDDPNYDALIAALYPDIEKYEEEDLAFHEEEKARNKQIQDSIAETSRRQAEALGKKRASSRSTSSTYHRRQGNYRNVSTRRNHRVTEHHGSDEDEGGKEHDDVSKDSTSTDEHFAEVRSKRYKKRGGGARASQPSSGGAKGGYDGNDSEGNRDVLIGTSSVGPIGIGIGCTEFLGWGRGGLRSSLRNGGLSWGNNRPSRNKRLAKLVKYLQCSHENNEMLKLSLMIVPLHEDKMPCLKQPYLSSSPTSSVGNLCQYVAAKTCVGASEIEILIVKDSVPIKYTSDAPKEKKSATFDPSYHELQLLNENQTLEEIHTQYNEPNLVLAYRLKERPQVNL